MRRCLLCLSVLAAGTLPTPADPPPGPAAPKLLLAFCSVRNRRAPPYPEVFFYEHDGVGTGKLLGPISSITKGVNFTRSDMRPSLSRDGRLCAFSAQFGVTDGGRVEIWDREEKKLLPLPSLNTSTNVHRMSPTLTGDGKRVAFAAWNLPGGSPRWGVYLYDRTEKKLIDLPGLNSDRADLRMPSLSGDGRWLAHAWNGRGGAGLTDVGLYDLKERRAVPLPGVNSKNMDTQPSLSGDGRLLAFTSDRPGGAGGRDVYLFDRTAGKFLPLPGLNTADHEQSPALSADGRYLAFVSERRGGAGERDVYLYDREKGKLLPTPGLNSKEDDYDPCVVVLEPRR